jgi:hypothetical protein
MVLSLVMGPCRNAEFLWVPRHQSHKQTVKQNLKAHPALGVVVLLPLLQEITKLCKQCTVPVLLLLVY